MEPEQRARRAPQVLAPALEGRARPQQQGTSGGEDRPAREACSLGRNQIERERDECRRAQHERRLQAGPRADEQHQERGDRGDHDARGVVVGDAERRGGAEDENDRGGSSA